jgi:hypothetical protein
MIEWGFDSWTTHPSLHVRTLGIPAIIASLGAADVRKGLVPRYLVRIWVAILDSALAKRGSIVRPTLIHELTQRAGGCMATNDVSLVCSAGNVLR